MKSRMIRIGAILAGGTLLTLGLASPAAAADDPYAETALGYEQLGVDPETSQALIDTLSAGYPVESMLEGSTPVYTEAYIQDGDSVFAKDGDQVTVRWYSDGSPSVTATEVPVEQATGGTSTREIQGCSYSSGSGYASATGCVVTAWWGTVQIGFMADYTHVQGGADYISNAYSGWQRCIIPTSCSGPNETAANYHEGVNAAFSKWTANVASPVMSWDVWTSIHVGNDTVWQESS